MTNLRLLLLSATITLAHLAAAGSPAAQPAAPAQEPLTLAEALRRAIGGNLELRRERVTIEIAEAQLLSARGAFDFVLDGSGTFTRQIRPALGAYDLNAGYENRLALDLGLVRPLETGGTVDLSVQHATSITNRRGRCGQTFTDPQVECSEHDSALSLGFTHPLLRGLGSEIAQANVRRQRVLRDQALLNRQTRAANVLRDVITTYWELAYATNDLAIRRSAVELAQEQLRITQAQIEVGRLAKIDAAAVERAIGERLQEVVLAEQTLYFQSLALRQLLGLAPDATAPPFAAADAPTATPPSVDVAGELVRALEVNPQLKSLRLGLRLSEIDIQTAVSTVRPRLDFVGRVGSAGRDEDLGRAVETTVAFEQMTWSAGLQFQLPLQNRTARGQLQAARLSQERVGLDATSFELELRELVLQLATRIKSSARRVELSRATVGFAQQNLEAERARFSVGRSTNNDVLLRQQELKTEEIRLLRATVDLLESEVALSAATGEILERYNIVLRGS